MTRNDQDAAARAKDQLSRTKNNLMASGTAPVDLDEPLAPFLKKFLDSDNRVLGDEGAKKVLCPADLDEMEKDVCDFGFPDEWKVVKPDLVKLMGLFQKYKVADNDVEKLHDVITVTQLTTVRDVGEVERQLTELKRKTAPCEGKYSDMLNEILKKAPSPAAPSPA